MTSLVVCGTGKWRIPQNEKNEMVKFKFSSGRKAMNRFKDGRVGRVLGFAAKLIIGY